MDAGCGATVPRQRLRYIRWRRGGTRYELLTNVLTPARLSAEEALDLYPYRWGIERMFFDLKEVLNLNRLYAADPNAVAMQVYAAAIAYNALRVAQGEGAAQVGVAPETISPAKFTPRSSRPRSCTCTSSSGSVSGVASIRAIISASSQDGTGGTGRPPALCKSSDATSTVATAVSVQRAVSGSLSHTSVAADDSYSELSRYLSGDAT